jgi:hypothetical protein
VVRREYISVNGMVGSGGVRGRVVSGALSIVAAGFSRNLLLLSLCVVRSRHRKKFAGHKGGHLLSSLLIIHL